MVLQIRHDNTMWNSNMTINNVVVTTSSRTFSLVYFYYFFHIVTTVSTFAIVTAWNHIQQNHVTTQRRHDRPRHWKQHQYSYLSLSRTINELSEYTTEHKQINSPIHVVVVGGGVGGLAIASRIATAKQTSGKDHVPIRVTLLEKNSETGGRCGSFDVTIPDPTLPTVENEKSKLVFRHERGPSLLLLPQMYQQLFSDVTVGQQVAQDFGLYIKQCVPAYTVVFDDGDRINLGFPKESSAVQKNSELSSNLKLLQTESRNMMNQFETNGAQKWDDYMRLCRAYLECGLPNFIEERLDLNSFPNFIVEGVLRNFGQRFPLKSHRDVLDTYFTSEKMCALASFQDLYVGLQPFRSITIGGGVGQSTAPAVFGLLSAIELHPDVGGVYAPIGGFRAVQESLHRLATSYSNVTIQKNSTVVHVTNEGVYYYNTTQGQDTDPPAVLQFLKADVIVINADLPYAEQSLFSKQQDEKATVEFHMHQQEGSTPLSTERRMDEPRVSLPENGELLKMTYDWDDRYQFSSGVIAFHWSVNQSLDELNTHNVFLSASNRTDAYQSWNYVRNVTLPTSSMMTNINEPFNFYVHRASKTDSTAAPSGMDAIMILVPCPTLQRNVSYSSLPRKEALVQYKNEQFSDELIDRVRTAVLHRLEVLPTLLNLHDRILDEVVDTPVHYADQYNVGAGTPFGLSHGLQQLSIFRPPSIFDRSSPPSSNSVFFCGASTRPGNGVPLVLTSAKLVAEKVMKFVNDL